MDFGAVFSRARKIATDNSPMILTAIGVTGTITTAVLAYRSGFKAAHILEDERTDILPTRVGLQMTWKTLVPSIGSGIATITCIIMANRINMRRSAALASAYMVIQEGFAEYKSKVIDRLGDNGEREIRNEIAEERIKKNPPPRTLIVSGKNCIVHDVYSDRWFTSSYDELQQAAIDINFQIINEGFASLSDFWRRLGVSHAAMGDEVGWSSDRKLELDLGGALSDDGMPVLTLDFLTVPSRQRNSY